MDAYTRITCCALWLFFGLVSGCLPRTGGNGDEPVQSASVRVPAALGVTVEVSARVLMDVDPAWRRAGRDGALAVAVTFGDESIPCEVNGGADGTFDEDDRITFVVAHENRHSPWLTYRITRVRDGDGVLCRLTRYQRRPATLLDEAFGRIQGEVVAVRSDEDNEAALSHALRLDTQYLVIAPQKLMPAIGSLVAHRRQQYAVTQLAAEDVYDRLSGGNPDPEAIRRAVELVWRRTNGRLKYLLLVGDARVAWTANQRGPTPIPTFYERKVHYPGYVSDDEFPTDHRFGVIDGHPRVAVGRLPAGGFAEARAFADKIVAYETADGGGDWQRRLVLFGGPANYGAIVDRVIESIAANLLNRAVPYDFDLSVMFAKADSPYAWPFDRLDERMVGDLNAGSLFAAYFGHGLEAAFDSVTYRSETYTFGEAESLEQLAIGQGKPVFLSFTCHTGAFDRRGGEPGLGEVMANHKKGPVAVFASSRASHPYPNALYAQAFVDIFLRGRPTTLGDGLLTMKRQLNRRRLVLAEALVGQDIDELKAEHLGLYNLLGDPALRLRYPKTARVVTPAAVDRDTTIEVAVAVPKATSGTVLVTLETERIRIRSDLTAPDALAAMPVAEAFEAMAKNLPRALDKVVLTRQAQIVDGEARIALPAPSTAGTYIVKALVEGHNAAIGHARVDVLDQRVSSASDSGIGAK